jgi:hypothetical protein
VLEDHDHVIVAGANPKSARLEYSHTIYLEKLIEAGMDEKDVITTIEKTTMDWLNDTIGAV